MSFNEDKIEGIIRDCLKKLRSQDKYLLDKDANERTIAHKLAEYLQEQFLDYNVDCEYNRFKDLTKILEVPKDKINWDDTEAKTVFPDIIVHKRGLQECNFVVIEIKKYKKILRLNVGNFDKVKLQAFTIDPYNYKLGLFLLIDMEDGNDIFEWFSKGIKINQPFKQ